MTKLQSEFERLFLVRPEAAAQPAALIGAAGTVRAMVLELTRTPDWEVLSPVWRGVQTELELPAPAIAVSGVDALQLWFSLAQPVEAAQASGFLEGLRQRFLPDVDVRRVRMLPAADASAQAGRVPAVQPDTGNWSAFVAPDLAPVFGETPWLDIPPNEEGQANLLRAIASIQPAEFEAAMARLGARPHVPPAATVTPLPHRSTPPRGDAAEPRRFLLQVMHDETVAMGLRIEAAKALLQHSGA